MLVTGARGALGGHTAKLLASAGAEVFATERTRGEDIAGVRWLACDLQSPDQVRAAVDEARPTAVVHVAGYAAAADLGALIAANVIPLANLLEALRGSDLDRLVVVGSAAEYAPASGREAIAEDHPLGPVNAYGLSKVFQFELSRLAVRAGTPLVYARPFNLIGPDTSAATAVGDITRRLAAVIEEGGDVLDVGDLAKWRDYTDVRDAAAACATLLERGEDGAVYNICTGVPVLLSEVVERLVAAAGRPVTLRRGDRGESVSYQVGDPTRLRALGWVPVHDLDRSLRDGLESELRAVERSR